MKEFAKSLVLVAAIGSSPAALAYTNVGVATAWIDLNFVVQDLTPTDGTTAGYTFTPYLPGGLEARNGRFEGIGETFIKSVSVGGYFDLLPYTRLDFSAQASNSAFAPWVGEGLPVPFSCSFSVFASYAIDGYGGHINEYRSGSAFFPYGASYCGIWSGGIGVSGYWENNSSEVMRYRFHINSVATAYSDGVPTAVPEPSAWLLAIGAGAVLTRLRNSRRHSSVTSA